MYAPEAREAARAAAEIVLRDLWDEDLYPVDPFKIASTLGIRVLTGDLPDDVSGMLRGADGQVTMYIDTEDPYTRQRFTAAHELGHFFERGQNTEIAFIDRRSERHTGPGAAEEMWADEFAACLLMPPAIVRHLHRRGLPAWDLAKFFDVSPSAATNRLRNLGLER